MKPLYYHKYAQSINDNGQIIPQKEMRWYTPRNLKIAYEDIDLCFRERADIQYKLDNKIVIVHETRFLENLLIRLNESLFGDWVIIKTS